MMTSPQLLNPVIPPASLTPLCGEHSQEKKPPRGRKIKAQQIKPAKPPARRLQPETLVWGTDNHTFPSGVPPRGPTCAVTPSLWHAWWDDTQPWLYSLRASLLISVQERKTAEAKLNKACSNWSLCYGNCQHEPHTVCLFFPLSSLNTLKSLGPGHFCLRNKQTLIWASVSFHEHNLSPRFNKTHDGLSTAAHQLPVSKTSTKGQVEMRRHASGNQGI